jgi:hypothetical protein
LFGLHPAVGEGFDRMAAFVICAIDQHTPHAHLAHFAERDFLRAVRQNVPSFARCIAGDAGFLTLTLELVSI